MTPTTADKAKEIYFSIAKELTGDDWDFTADYERWLTTPEGSRLVGELGGDWKENWVSVLDELPELNDPEGVESKELKVKFEDGHKGSAWLHFDKGWCSWSIGKDNLPVTHWRTP